MKTLYGGLFAFTVLALVLGSAITIATSSAEALCSELAQYPEQWKIEINGGNIGLFAKDNDDAKKLVLEFFNKNPFPRLKLFEHLSDALLIVAFFSSIGWLRERQILKKRKQE